MGSNPYSLRIRQKPAHDPQSDQLNRESQTVVHSPAAINYRQIGIIQPTEALQVLRRYLIRQSAEPCGLLITQKIDRHATHSTGTGLLSVNYRTDPPQTPEWLEPAEHQAYSAPSIVPAPGDVSQNVAADKTIRAYDVNWRWISRDGTELTTTGRQIVTIYLEQHDDQWDVVGHQFQDMGL